MRHALDLLRRRILGIEEILQRLEAGAADLNQLHTHLLQVLGRDWKTTHPTRFRLSWLVACGAVCKADGRFALVKQGP